MREADKYEKMGCIMACITLICAIITFCLLTYFFPILGFILVLIIPLGFFLSFVVYGKYSDKEYADRTSRPYFKQALEIAEEWMRKNIKPIPSLKDICIEDSHFNPYPSFKDIIPEIQKNINFLTIRETDFEFELLYHNIITEKNRIRMKNLKKKMEKQKLERLSMEAKERYIPAFIRRRVWERDGRKCVLCGSNENLEFDHIIPFSKGGAHSVKNVRILCQKCNRLKGNNVGYD